MSDEVIRYWGYRIATDYINYFRNELNRGWLRQGWGWLPGQDLRKCGTQEFVDHGAALNLRIYNQVKKGNILFVPRLPEWDRVAIVEALEDFNQGYKFEIDERRGDFGHCFPAQMLGSFTRSAGVVSGDIRTTLRYQGRFWSIDYYREDIEKILASEENIRTRSQRPTEGLQKAVEQVVDNLRKDLYNLLDRDYEGKEWESILKRVFTTIYPNYLVELVGGRSESQHGTDILISVPGIGAGR